MPKKENKHIKQPGKATPTQTKHTRKKANKTTNQSNKQKTNTHIDNKKVKVLNKPQIELN